MQYACTYVLIPEINLLDHSDHKTSTGFTHLMAQASIFIVWHQVWFLLRNSFMLAFIQYTVAYPVHILVVLSGQVVV